MSSKRKKVTVSTFLSLAAVGGIVAFAINFYRRPWETVLAMARMGLLLIGVREEYCNLNGVLMRYYCAGRRGSPVVLVHGLGSSAETWAALIPLLSREHLVYAPDMPGFGKTPLAPEGTNIATHVLYLERFLNALGYPRVTLVGNSLGGWIATRFALLHPERVEHLYLLNSAGLRREGMNSPYVERREEALSTFKHLWGFSLPLPGFLLDSMIQNSQRPAYAGFIRGYDPAEELDSLLTEVKVPTTIIWGEKDRLLPLACAYDFERGIPGAELVLLPRTGHMPQMQAPLEVARVIM